MDSAGCLLPSEVKKIFFDLKKIKINFGFHAHNNLGNAIWNTIEAYKGGANILDVSIRGFGAGAGNAQMEILLTILKNGYKKYISKLSCRMAQVKRSSSWTCRWCSYSST
jgi:4-hydroxy 2-oxovalerate aldolase